MDYYLNNIAGSDADAGTSAGEAWRTLARASAQAYAPGDRLLLLRGCRFAGQLALRGDGAQGAPCAVEPYGEADARPCVEARGEAEAALLLEGVSHWQVRGLEITNEGPSRAALRMGILARLEDHGVARGLLLEDNWVHDVNGSNVKADGNWAGGIFVRAQGDRVPSRYEGVTIRGNLIERCDRVGISIAGMGRRDAWNPMSAVRIEGNTLLDIGGDGIVNIGTDGCLIARNRLLGARMRDDMYCAGIWPWSADNTLICFNEAAYVRGVKDGQGYDCDYNCVGTRHFGNYSHDNEGGYMLVCSGSRPHEMPRDIGCYGSRIERNLSVNDRCRGFHLAGGIVATTIADNCLYAGQGIDMPCVLASGYEETIEGPRETLFLRNIFAARGVLRYARATRRVGDGTYEMRDDPALPKMRFSGNSYLGTHVARPFDDAPPAHGALTLEALEELLLDGDCQAKPGLRTLDEYLDFMGWPKEPADII